ncbi:MAG TPA: TAXI family TRAP transporter solute-binding subunit [Beijerinckiaceae bacterium]|jgi:TRAP-type uncharacterized transport system substrate-binding protein|nr:TAXI family TRAP transporter solute-binding subunit [Beijerinckiaceae bacterium]
MRAWMALCVGMSCLGAGLAPAWSQAPKRTEAPPSVEARKNDINAWTIGLAGGLLEGSYIRYAADMAKVLDDGDNLRVIPLVTFGAVGNVSDLLYLKGVDAAITQSDALDYFKRDLNIPRIGDRIHYVSPLFLNDVHICARPEYKSLKDLEGKKVSFNTRGSAANLTGQIVFRRLNINVEAVFVNNSIAMEQMRKGELAAIAHVTAKPNDLFTSVKSDPACRFLPVEYSSVFSDFYLPTSLKKEDYPAFIQSGEVPTIAVQNVLAVFNWPKNSDRNRKLVRFIDAYFSKFEKLQQPPHQPKWKEINVAGTVPGWTRYAAAEEALARLVPNEEKSSAQLRGQFESFLNAQTARRGSPLSTQEREALFGEFLKWQQR